MMDEEKQRLLAKIDKAIEAIDRRDTYSIGMRNGMRYVKSLIDGKEQKYEKV
jgi:hypothetical protein